MIVHSYGSLPESNCKYRENTLVVWGRHHNYLYPPVICYVAIEKGLVETVDFPIQNGGSFHSYVKLPEGKSMV